jgi:hypothetical protein
MNGWNGFNIGNLNTGPGGWPGYTANMPPVPAPMASPAVSSSFSMPQGAQPAGWMGYNGMPGAGGATIPGAGGAPGGWFGVQGLGANLDTARLGIGALGSIASIWNASQQNKLAKASFNHQKGILDTNLANQIKSYNLSVDDKFRSRAVMEGRDTSSDIEKWSARDERRRG